MTSVTPSCSKKAYMLPQLDGWSKNCVRMCAIYQHKFITSALIVHYTSTTTATAKKLCFNTKTDQRVCFSCMHTMKITVQKMYFL